MKEYKIDQIIPINNTECKVVKVLKKSATGCTECIFKHFSPRCEHYLCGHLERSDHNDIIFLPLPSDKTLNKKENSVLDEGKQDEFPLPPKNMRVWIHGNKERGEEVIKALTDLGAKNIINQSGDQEEFIYFITIKGLIDIVSVGSDEASWISILYKEIKLPWKPKDKELVWAWDKNCSFGRCLRFYDAHNNLTFHSIYGDRLGARYDHYAPYEGKWPEWAKDAQKKLKE